MKNRQEKLASWSYMAFNKKEKKTEKVTLQYTVVLIDGKVIRVFNHVNMAATKKQPYGYTAYNSIDEGSEIFSYFKKMYDAPEMEIV